MLISNGFAAALFLMFGWNAHATLRTCSEVGRLVIPSAQIGMPTRGSIVRSARHAKGAGGGYCRVLGMIASLDPKAAPIRYEVNLPDTWNGKALQFGGGGFDGYLRQSDGRRWTVVGDKNQPSPLDRGYATFGSDSGHHHHYLFLPDIANIANAKFGKNDEERNNFASDGLKKLHDVAIVLMQTRYGASPTRVYFIGGSNGGREALKVVDRWPIDYDGVMAAYASWNQIETDLQFIRITQVMYAKGGAGQAGWLPPAKTKLLRSAVMSFCDAQDGVKDDIISNPSSCHFDPASLRCKDGKDRKGCLSDGQERTVAAFSAPQVTTFSVEHGMNQEAGYNVLRGADLVGNMGWFRHPFRPAIPYFNSVYYVFGDGVVRSFLTHGPQVSLFDIDTTNGSALGHDPKQYLPRAREQSVEDDASLADLSPFQRHGGKLLLVHGVTDSTIPTGASILLYSRIVAVMGQERADSFLRLYVIPGFGHGRGVFDAGFDTVGVLDRWADQGVAPADLVVTDQNKNANRTRPLCAWPKWPRYTGSDISSAASYTCTLNP
jgi:hypothetical protein